MVIPAACIVGLLIMGDSFLYSALPLTAASLGLSLVQVSWLLSANRWIRLVSNSLAAHRLSRMPLRILFSGAAGLGAVSTVMFALPWSFAPLLAARIAWGLAWSVFRQSAYAAVWMQPASGHGRLLGLWWGLVRLGSGLGVLLGGWLLDQRGFAAAMVGLSVLALLGAVASPALSWPPPQATEPTRPSQALSELAAAAWSCLRSPPRRSLLLLGAGSRLIMTLLIALTSLYLQDRLDASALGLGVIAGFVLALHWTSQIVAGPIMGALSDRIGRTRALAALVLALVVALALSGWVRGSASLFGMGAVMLLFSGLRVVVEAAASDAARAEAEPHLFMGVFTTADDWAAAMGPILGLSWFQADLILPFFAGCALLLLTLGFNYQRSLQGVGRAT